MLQHPQSDLYLALSSCGVSILCLLARLLVSNNAKSLLENVFTTKSNDVKL